MKTSNQAIKSLINDISASAQEVFGHRCLSVYIMGSLARGGFSEVASDIDIGLLFGEALKKSDSSTIEAIQTRVVKITHKLIITFQSSGDLLNQLMAQSMLGATLHSTDSI